MFIFCVGVLFGEAPKSNVPYCKNALQTCLVAILEHLGWLEKCGNTSDKACRRNQKATQETTQRKYNNRKTEEGKKQGNT